MSTIDHPRARHDLEFIPFEHEGRSMILVRDRLELVPYGAGVPSGLLPVLALMDGRRSLEELAAAITAARGGRAVTPDDLRGLLDELDQAGLLDTPRYREKKRAVAEAFAAQPVRGAAFAGQAYPGAPAELATYLDGLLAEAPAGAPGDGAPLAVIAPHLDPEAGRAGYAAAYGALRGATPDRVVVLGVGHQLLDGLFCLTDKAFATPLGEVPADAAAVAGLRRAGGRWVDGADLPHRAEHSVEFQAVFLRHVLGDRPFSMVPVLCGSPLGVLPEQSRRSFRECAGPFLEALEGLVREPGTLVVAGVDFSHIGHKFGHAEPAGDLEAGAMAHDRALLGALSRGDAEAFWAESARVEDRYNVCGLTALATLAEILPPSAMSVLCHDIMREPATRSAVSFAAAVFVPR